MRPKTSEDFVTVMQETMDTDGWTCIEGVFKEFIAKTRAKVLDGHGDVYLNQLWGVRWMLLDLYQAAKVDVPPYVEAILK
jgi:hypothetical protein